MRSPMGVPPGSRVLRTSTAARRRCSTSRRPCVPLPAPPGPSSVIKTPRTPGAGLLGEDHDAAQGFLAPTLRGEAVALDELVLHPADVGVLRREFHRLRRLEDLGDRLFHLAQRCDLLAHVLLAIQDL